jgi:hypothetical protein
VKPSLEMAGRFDKVLDAGGALVEAARLSRRTVLAGGLLAGSLLAAAPETAERLAWAQRHPARIDTAAVDSLADVLTAQRRADDVLGSAAVLRPALAQLASVETLVRQAGGPVRPALVNIAQQWCQFGSWLCRSTAP